MSDKGVEKKKKDIVMNKETMERLGVEDVPPLPPKDPLAEDQDGGQKRRKLSYKKEDNMNTEVTKDGPEHYSRMPWPCDTTEGERYLEDVRKGQISPLELAQREGIPAHIRFWVLLREEFIPFDRLYKMACKWTQRVLEYEREQGRDPDKRSWDAVKAGRLWLERKITREERKDLCDKAWEAFWRALEARGDVADEVAADYPEWRRRYWGKGMAGDAALLAAQLIEKKTVGPWYIVADYSFPGMREERLGDLVKELNNG